MTTTSTLHKADLLIKASGLDEHDMERLHTEFVEDALDLPEDDALEIIAERIKTAQYRETLPEWEDEFTGVEQPNGGVMLERFIDRPEDESHLWTVTDVDGELYIVPGWHYVNRFDYVYSTEPWTEEHEGREWAW